MTGPVIPADQWPEGTDRHCWDANGLGVFYGPLIARTQVWLSVMKLSHIPLPACHDWRVPVMRPAAEEVRAQANMDAGWYARREAHARDMGYAGVAEALDDLESRRSAPALDLGKLRAFAESVIDRGHRGDCESRHWADNRCDCGVGPTKQEARDLLALIDGQGEPFTGELRPEDLEVTGWPCRPSGLLFTTPKGVKITHKPTGTIVTCDTERSQHVNRDRAMNMLRAKLQPAKGEGVGGE